MQEQIRPETQMLCANCCRSGAPDTWIPGSDLVELAAWCCLGLPGLLYCFWRHLARAKVCAFCGSLELIREARASKRPARIERRVRRLHSAGDPRWPSVLHAPLSRIQRGLPLAAAGVAASASALIGFIEIGSAVVVTTATLWITGWLFLQLGLLYDAPPPCRAWDESGRSLAVEWLGTDPPLS